MIHLLSPAKSLDFKSDLPIEQSTSPALLHESKVLAAHMKKVKQAELKSLMSISDQLSQLNVERFQNWQAEEELSKDSRQAIFAFTGDVYKGLDAYSLNETDLNYAQNNLGILSGLYGLLRPLDVIEAYRLEMGTKLKIKKADSLYDFWGEKITEQLNQWLEAENSEYVINLASNEYFKSVKPNLLKAKVISPEFKDAKNGKYKIISFYAKKARGLMSRFIIQNKIEKVADLQAFDLDGYRYNQELSSETKPIFTREENQK